MTLLGSVAVPSNNWKLSLRRACRRAAMVLADGELEMTKCLDVEGGASSGTISEARTLSRLNRAKSPCRPASSWDMLAIHSSCLPSVLLRELAVAFILPAAGLALPTPAGRFLFSFSKRGLPLSAGTRSLVGFLDGTGRWVDLLSHVDSGFNACRFSLQACSCASRVLECCCISPNGQYLWRPLQLNTAA